MPRPSCRAKAGKRNASADALPLDEEQPGNNTQAAGCTPKKKVRWKNDDFPGCEEEEQSPSPPSLPPTSADARRTATEHHKHVLEIDNRTGLTPPNFHVAFGRGADDGSGQSGAVPLQMLGMRLSTEHVRKDRLGRAVSVGSVG